ncbi:MAG: leucine-rich repeat domain-containing protein [Candidatus Helarchaeota archaeon]|nr:leucine-rich repeat domain-containing protein [Candidatus Helarchaeota archaeon]
MEKIKDLNEKNAIANLNKYFDLEAADFEVDENGFVIELDLHANDLEDIPIIIFDLPHLQIIHIHGTKIKKIEGLEKLSNLEELHLYGNQIKKIEGLENISQLKVLNLAYNQINKIEGLENLTQLKQLLLEGNNIGKIENLENLTQLEVLRLEANQIKKIEGLEKLSMIKELELSDNKIQKIEGLRKLSELKTLNIRLNEINKMEGLESLSQLKNLDLRLNEIQKMECLEQLSELKTLDLRLNKITEIKGLEYCPQLKNFRLDKENLRKKDQTLYEEGIKEEVGQVAEGEIKVKEIPVEIHIPKLKFEDNEIFKKDLQSMSTTNQNLVKMEILAIPDDKRAAMVKTLLKSRKKLNKLLEENVSEIEKLLQKKKPSLTQIFQKMEASKSIYEELGDEDKAQSTAMEIEKILNKFDSIKEKKELSREGAFKIKEAKAALSRDDYLKAALLYRIAARFFIEIGNHEQAELLRQDSNNCENAAK